MVTDIVESTAVSQTVGDLAYLDLVLRHHSLVRRCLNRCSGHEFSEAGDGLLAWFATTSDAIRCACEILSELDDSAAIEPKLRIKIGLAGGVPLFHHGRPYGLVLNRAARLVNQAPEGHIVVDEAVAGHLEDPALLARTETVDLKGIGAHNIAYLKPASNAYQRW